MKIDITPKGIASIEGMRELLVNRLDFFENDYFAFYENEDNEINEFDKTTGGIERFRKEFLLDLYRKDLG